MVLGLKHRKIWIILHKVYQVLILQFEVPTYGEWGNELLISEIHSKGY